MKRCNFISSIFGLFGLGAMAKAAIPGSGLQSTPGIPDVRKIPYANLMSDYDVLTKICKYTDKETNYIISIYNTHKK